MKDSNEDQHEGNNNHHHHHEDGDDAISGDNGADNDNESKELGSIIAPNVIQRMEMIHRRRSVRLSRQSTEQFHDVEQSGGSDKQILKDQYESYGVRVELQSHNIDRDTVVVDIRQLSVADRQDEDADDMGWTSLGYCPLTRLAITHINAPRIIFSWRDVYFSIKINKNTTKEILQRVNGVAKPGQMLGLMGPSGAGKSSLLNVLSGKLSNNAIISGNILLNGRKRPSYWKYMFGYLEQRAVFYQRLTVRESITFAVFLRAGVHLSFQEKMVRVENIIHDLGLSGCSDQIVTDSGGPSDGERRRLCIGVELAADPAVLLLDEPTSGLDATISYNIMESINIVAIRYSKTVIACVHQPREDILFLFTNILLISQGRIIYCGSVTNAILYFDRLGFKYPKHLNPADFFMDVISIKPLHEHESKERIKLLHDEWEKIQDALDGSNNRFNTYDDIIADQHSHHHQHDNGDGNRGNNNNNSDNLNDNTAPIINNQDDGDNNTVNVFIGDSTLYNHSWPNSRMDEFLIVFRREFISVRRDSDYIFTLSFYTVFYFVILSMTFFQLPLTQAGINSRVGLLFVIPVDAMYSAILLLLPRLIQDKPVIKKERETGSYRTLSIFLAKTITVLVVRFFFMSLLCLSFYYIVGLAPEASSYFIFLGTMLSLVFTCHAMAFAMVALSPTPNMTFAIGIPICIFFVIYGGLLINTLTVPPVINLLEYASIIRYAYTSLFRNEFQYLQFTCQDPATGQTVSCNNSNVGYANGTQVIQEYAMDNLSITACLLTLIGIGFAGYIVAYIGFRISLKPKYKIV